MAHLCAGEGTVAVSADCGVVLALDLATGEGLWQLPYSTPLGLGDPAMDAWRIYVGGDDGLIRALDRRSGRLLWQQQLGAVCRARPTLLGERVFIATDAGWLVALEAATGRPMWQAYLGSAIGAEAALAGDLLVCPTVSDGVCGVSAWDGRIAWRVDTEGAALAPAAIAGEMALVGCDDRRLYVIGLASGEVECVLELGDVIRTQPLVEGDRAHVLTASGQLFTLSTDDWHLVRATQPSDSVTTAICARPGELLFGDARGRISRVGLSDGRVRTRLRCSAPPEGELVSADGMVVATLEGGSVVALPLGEP